MAQKLNMLIQSLNLGWQELRLLAQQLVRDTQNLGRIQVCHSQTLGPLLQSPSVLVWEQVSMGLSHLHHAIVPRALHVSNKEICL